MPMPPPAVGVRSAMTEAALHIFYKKKRCEAFSYYIFFSCISSGKAVY
jgi:hypothetical protein